MSEHTHTGAVTDATNYGYHRRWVGLPDDWPPGAEVTVTWTEPDPEPSGRWVTLPTIPAHGPRAAMWDDGRGDYWPLRTVAKWEGRDYDEAEAALVDLIESDHLPPQMPSVDDIDDWLIHQGYGPYSTDTERRRQVIRGTLDYFAAKAAHGRTGT